MEQLHPHDPHRIGPYRLLSRLGAGGMGQVCLARSDRGRSRLRLLPDGSLQREPTGSDHPPLTYPGSDRKPFVSRSISLWAKLVAYDTAAGHCGTWSR